MSTPIQYPNYAILGYVEYGLKLSITHNYAQHAMIDSLFPQLALLWIVKSLRPALAIPQISNAINVIYIRCIFTILIYSNFGNFIPLLVYILWNYVMLGILAADVAVKNSEIVTQLLEGTVSVISIVLLIKSFSLFALLTSFIPNAISLVDFIKDASRNSLNKIVKSDIFYLGVIFIPSFLFTIIYPNLFLNMLDFAGGFIDVLLFGLLPALIVLTGRKTIVDPQYQVFGGKITPILILIFSLVILVIKAGVLYV